MFYNIILNTFPTFLPLTYFFTPKYLIFATFELCLPAYVSLPQSTRGYLSFVMAAQFAWSDYLLSFRQCPVLPVSVSVSACPSVYLRKKAKKQSQSQSQSRVKNLMRFGMLLGNNSWINAIWLKLISLLAFSAFSNLSRGMERRQGRGMLGGPHLDDDADAFSGVFFDILAT